MESREFTEVPPIQSYQKTAVEVYIQTFSSAAVYSIPLDMTVSLTSLTMKNLFSHMKWVVCTRCGSSCNHMRGEVEKFGPWMFEIADLISEKVQFVAIKSATLVYCKSLSNESESTACPEQDTYMDFERENRIRVVLILSHPESDRPLLEVRIPPIRKSIGGNCLVLSRQVGFQVHTSTYVYYAIIELDTKLDINIDIDEPRLDRIEPTDSNGGDYLEVNTNEPTDANGADYLKYLNNSDLGLDENLLNVFSPIDNTPCPLNITQLLKSGEPHNCQHHDSAKIEEKKELFRKPLDYIPNAFCNILFFPKNYQKLENFLRATKIPFVAVVLDIGLTKPYISLKAWRKKLRFFARLITQRYVYAVPLSNYTSKNLKKTLPAVSKRYRIPIANVFGREIRSSEINKQIYVYKGLLILNNNQRKNME